MLQHDEIDTITLVVDEIEECFVLSLKKEVFTTVLVKHKHIGMILSKRRCYRFTIISLQPNLTFIVFNNTV